MFGIFASMTGMRNDLRELGEAVSYTIRLVLQQVPAPVAPQIPKSPLELLEQHAKDGNITEFCSRFQNITTQNPPLPQAQFNPNLYINTLLSNIGMYEPKTVIDLKKLLECLNTIDVEPRTSLAIIEKMSSIVAVLGPTDRVLLENYKHYQELVDQIAAHKHAKMQEGADDTVKEIHGPDASEELFVVVGVDALATHPENPT